MADLLRDGTTERPGMPETFHLKLSSFNALAAFVNRGLLSDTSLVWEELMSQSVPAETVNNLITLFNHITDLETITDREELTRLVAVINQDPNVPSADKRISVVLGKLLTSVNS